MYLSPPWSRAVLALVMAVAVFMWVITQNFGMILAGGATDPDSGPLLVLLALCYWPLKNPVRATARRPPTVTAAHLAAPQVPATSGARASSSGRRSMTHPVGLAYLFAAIAGAVGLYCLGRLLAVVSSGRQSHYGVNAAHVLMAIAMVGMLVPSWRFLPVGLWEVVFGAMAACFVAMAARAAATPPRPASCSTRWSPCPSLPDPAVMALAMIDMYHLGSPTTDHGSMTVGPGTASHGQLTHRDPRGDAPGFGRLAARRHRSLPARQATARCRCSLVRAASAPRPGPTSGRGTHLPARGQGRAARRTR